MGAELAKLIARGPPSRSPSPPTRARRLLHQAVGAEEVTKAIKKQSTAARMMKAAKVDESYVAPPPTGPCLADIVKQAKERKPSLRVKIEATAQRDAELAAKQQAINKLPVWKRDEVIAKEAMQERRKHRSLSPEKKREHAEALVLKEKFDRARKLSLAREVTRRAHAAQGAFMRLTDALCVRFAVQCRWSWKKLRRGRY